MDKYPDAHGVYGSPELQQLWQRIAALQKRIVELETSMQNALDHVDALKGQK